MRPYLSCIPAHDRGFAKLTVNQGFNAARFMSTWSLQLIGDCRLHAPDGTPVRLATRKALALLAYLAVQRDRRAGRQRAASLLWENADAEQGRVHLRKALWIIRSECERVAPGIAPPVESAGEDIRLTSSVLVDMEAVLGPDQESDALPDRLGEFLGDFHIRNAESFEQWAESQRQHLRNQLIRRGLAAAEQLLASEQPDLAVRSARQVLSLDPLQEPAHRLVMRGLQAEGRSVEALHQFRLLSDLLRDELGVAPDSATEEVRRTIVEERRSEPEAAAESDAVSRTLQATALLNPEPPSEPPRPGRWSRWLVGGAIGLAAASAAAAVAGLSETEPRIGRIFPIVPGVDVAGSPSLSPNGRQVVFTGTSGGQGGLDLYLMNIGDRSARRLTSGPAGDDRATWSPDGSAIAFVRRDARRPSACRILVVPATGGAEREVAGCSGLVDSPLSWSPDGSSILTADSTTPGAPSAIVEVTLSGARRRLTRPPDGAPGDRSPIASSDGRHLAFLRFGTRDTAEAMLLDRSTGEVRQLTQDSAAIGGLAFDPDGRGLLFSSDRGGDAGLWWVSRRGGSPRRVSEGLLRYRQLSAARTGSRLVFEGVRDRSGLHPLSAVRPTAASLSSGNAFRDWSPDVAADGRVVFVSVRSGEQQLWIEQPGRPPRQITRLKGWHIADPRWSPDGHSIAFVGTAQGSADLFILEVASGRVQRITSDPAEESSPAWMANGGALYFVSLRGGGPSVWRVAAAPNARPLRMSHPGVGEVRTEPTGRWLYYTLLGRAGVFRRPVRPDGRWAARGEQVLQTVGTPPISWAVTAKGLFLADGNRLRWVDLATGASRDLADASALNSRSAFAVGPEGGIVLNSQFQKVELYGIELD